MISRRRRYRRYASRLIVCATLTVALALVFALPAWAGIPGGPKNPPAVAVFSPGDFPESLAIDADGNMFVSLGFRGEIVKVAPDGTQSPVATIEVGDGLITGLALGPAGELYVGVATFSADPAPYVAVIDSGEPTIFATLPEGSFPNGLAYRDGHLYVSDSDLGTIWRIDSKGTVDEWLTDPLLQPTKFIGANGIAFDDQGDLWVAVSDTGSILRVPVSEAGAAGTPAVVVRSAKLKTADGIAFDADGGLYIAVNRTDELYVLTSEGALVRVANRSDGLSYPTEPAFGTTQATHHSLFLTNGALYNGVANLIKFDVGVGGLLLP